MAHVTMIHGIANKPPPDVLLDAWERALADDDGIDLGTRGVTSSMVYWANILYDEYSEPTLERTEDDHPTDVVETSWLENAPEDERRWATAFAENFPADSNNEEPTTDDRGQERLTVPGPALRAVMKILLRDVHHYLFNARHEPRPGEVFRVRDEVRRRTIEALDEGASRPGPHLVLSHSMGTVIAYDCLKRVDDCPPVDGLITLGSPLGIQEIPVRLKPEWTAENGFPSDRLRGDWINVFDRFDPVGGPTPRLARVYRREGTSAVVDIEQPGWGRWRHSIAKYLAGPDLRSQIARMLEPS